MYMRVYIFYVHLYIQVYIYLSDTQSREPHREDSYLHAKNVCYAPWRSDVTGRSGSGCWGTSSKQTAWWQATSLLVHNLLWCRWASLSLSYKKKLPLFAGSTGPVRSVSALQPPLAPSCPVRILPKPPPQQHLLFRYVLLNNLSLTSLELSADGILPLHSQWGSQAKCEALTGEDSEWGKCLGAIFPHSLDASSGTPDIVLAPSTVTNVLRNNRRGQYNENKITSCVNLSNNNNNHNDSFSIGCSALTQYFSALIAVQLTALVVSS